MDYHKLRLISWQSGRDFRDCNHEPGTRQYRLVAARRARKADRRRAAREIEGEGEAGRRDNG